MATLLMPPDHHQNHQQNLQNHHQPQQQQRRSKKAKNGQKKQPQRGLGVAELEKRRLQEERKMMLASSFGSSPFQAQNQNHHHHGVLALYQHQIHQAQAAAAFRNVNAPMIPPAMVKNDSGSSNHSNYDHHSPHTLNLNLNLHQQHLLPDHEGMLSGSFSSSSDSGSCKSGISSNASLVLQNKQQPGQGGSSSSPSPCSSSQHNNKSHFDEGGDESSKAARAFLVETSKSSNQHHHSLLHQGHLIQPVSSSRMNKECSPFGLMHPESSSSDLFDPSFRIRSRDCREWPGVYSIPAIKELSSFQIPGNTNPAALSCANRIHAQASATTITTATTGASINKAGVRDGSPGTDVHIGLLAEPRPVSAKIVGSSSSSPIGPGAGSSWGARSEMGCFPFDATKQQQIKDSCSSSLNNGNKNAITNTMIMNNKNNSLNLALELSSFENEEAAMNFRKNKAMNSNRHLGFLNSSANNSSCSTDEAESSSKQQEASSTSEDWGPRKSIKLHPFCTPGSSRTATAGNAFMLELSLKVPSTGVPVEDDDALELKLAL